MSLAEIEKQVLALPEEERQQFAMWFYENEGKIAQRSLDHDEDSAVSPEVMDELLRRRGELDGENGGTFTLESMSARVREALDEVHRSGY